jgi:hypothetical protein
MRELVLSASTLSGLAWAWMSVTCYALLPLPPNY